MNKKQLLQNIKANIIKLATTHKFSDYVLTDNTKITTPNELEVGAEVYSLDDSGNQTAMNDGDYVINDGRTITVKDGTITAITGDATTNDESTVADANVKNKKAKMEDGMPEPETADTDLATRISDIEANIESIMEMLKALSETSNKASEQMMSKIKKLSAEPGGEPIINGKKGMEDMKFGKKNAKQDTSAVEEFRERLNKRIKAEKI
jgi:hypothetical protein